MDELDRLAEMWYKQHRDQLIDMTDDEVTDLAYQTVSEHLSRKQALAKKPQQDTAGLFSLMGKTAARDAAKPFARPVDVLTNKFGEPGGTDLVGDLEKKFDTSDSYETEGVGAQPGAQMRNMYRRLMETMIGTGAEFGSSSALFGGLGKAGGALINKAAGMSPAIGSVVKGVEGLGKAAGAGLSGLASSEAGKVGMRAMGEALPGQLSTSFLFDQLQGQTDPKVSLGFGVLGAGMAGLGAMKPQAPAAKMAEAETPPEIIGRTAPRIPPEEPRPLTGVGDELIQHRAPQFRDRTDQLGNMLDDLIIEQSAELDPLSTLGGMPRTPAEPSGVALDPHVVNLFTRKEAQKLRPAMERASFATPPEASDEALQALAAKNPQLSKAMKAKAAASEAPIIQQSAAETMVPEPKPARKMVKARKGKGSEPAGVTAEDASFFTTAPPKAGTEASTGTRPKAKNLAEAKTILAETGEAPEGYIFRRNDQGVKELVPDPKGGAASAPAKPFRRKRKS